MATRTFSDDFTVAGEWFLPSSPGKRVPGTLTYSHDSGAEVALSTAFTPIQEDVHLGDAAVTYEVVWGITVKGEMFTLFDVLSRGTSFNMTGGISRQTERIVSSRLLIGTHVQSDFGFPNMRFRVPSLPIWLGNKSIHQDIQRDNSGNVTLVFRVSPQAGEDVEISEDEMTIKWQSGWANNSDSFTKINFEMFSWIEIVPKQPQSLDWFLYQHAKVRSFLSIAADHVMSPDAAEVNFEPHVSGSLLLTLQDQTYCSFKNSFEFFLTRDDLEVEFGEVLRAWFAGYSKISTASDLVLAVMSARDLWLNVEFLFLMQGLEGIHRSQFSSSFADDANWTLIKNALLQAVPTTTAHAHAQALRSRIEYGNELSLNRRVREIAGLLTDELRLKIFGPPDGKVPQAWIDTRNYYTHWDEKLKDRILETEELFYANVRLRHLLRAVLLCNAGVPQDVIAVALDGASHGARLLQQANALARRKLDPDDRSGLLMRVTKTVNSSDPDNSSSKLEDD